MAYCIYGIIDPKDGAVIYIGYTCNFRARKSSHEYQLSKNTHGNQQLQNLYNARLSVGQSLDFRVILEGSFRLMVAAEVGHIAALFSEIGNRCCNVRMLGEFASEPYPKYGKRKRSLVTKNKKRWAALEQAMRDVVVACKVSANYIQCDAETRLLSAIFRRELPVPIYPDVDGITPSQLERTKPPKMPS